MQLPRVEVAEVFVKADKERQVESADMDAFDDLFGMNRYDCRTAFSKKFGLVLSVN